MIWNNNIPQPGSVPANTQAPLLQNMTNLPLYLAINHDAFGLASEGKHKFVSMPDQAVDPVGLAGESTLFSHVSPITGVTELAWRRGVGAPVEFTGHGGLNGWTRLPSGILIKWGNFTANGATPVAYDATVPFASVYSIMVTPWGTANLDTDFAVRVMDIAPGGLFATFTAWGSHRTTTVTVAVPCYYLAIGI
jgi:hypothetical protein